MRPGTGFDFGARDGEDLHHLPLIERKRVRQAK